MNTCVCEGMPAGAQIINTAGGKQVYTIVTTASALRSMSLFIITTVSHLLGENFPVKIKVKIFIAMQPVKVEMIQDSYTTLQNTK